MRFPAKKLPHVWCEAVTKRGVLHPPRQLRVPDTRPSGLSVPDGYAMLMRLNKAETAVHERLPFEWNFW